MSTEVKVNSSSSKTGSLQKVILRKLDGQTFSGFADRRQINTRLRIIDRTGTEQFHNLSEVKALFFVKDFKGDPKYKDVHFLGKQPGSTAVWVRVRFKDGERLEGRIENNLNLITGEGFFLWPSDSETNNDCAYLPKASLEEFTILSSD